MITENLESGFKQALLSLDRLTAKRILMDSSTHGTPVQGVEDIVIPALEDIGRGWEQGSIALSQVYMSGRICEELIDSVLPLGSPGLKSQPKMAIAVLDDHHLLGKRIVYSVLRASGYELLDYGHGLTAKDLVRRVRDDAIDILLISVLMLASALHVKEVRNMLDSTNARTTILVGGAPFRFDSQLWKEVGADAMGSTASDVLELVNNLIKERRIQGFE